MKFLEKDLEEIIFTTPQLKLMEKGLDDFPSKIKRQLCLGNYGRADLVGFHWGNDHCPITDKCRLVPIFSIIELKQDKISVSAFLQALNYVKGVKHYLRKKKIGLYENARFQVTLIGKNIDDSGSFVYIPELLSSDELTVSFYTYDYTADGISFKSHHSYQLTNPGF